MNIYIDVGSTNIKWKYDNDCAHYIPFPLPCVNEGVCFEVRAEEIFRIVQSLLRGAQRAFLSVQMHGYVLLKNSKEVTNYISWRDERAKNFAPNFTIDKEYGVDIKPNLPRLSLQTQKVSFDQFCTLGSYLIYRLTGKNETHISDAAPSGFYNVHHGTREPVPFALPNAQYTVKAVGRYENTEIYTPVGDQQASILGAGNHFDGYILNLGTAGQLCCIENGFCQGEFESRPFFDGKTLCTVTRLLGGEVIAQYDDREIEERLVKDYKSALKKLPTRNKLLVTGGVVQYRKKLLCRVLDQLSLPYCFNIGSDALKGLEIIAKGEVR